MRDGLDTIQMPILNGMGIMRWDETEWAVSDGRRGFKEDSGASMPALLRNLWL